MLTLAQINQTRKEARFLRIASQNLKRALLYQKGKNEELAKENQKLKDDIKKIEKEKQQIADELEKVKKQRDTYRNMVFKANKKSSVEEDFASSTQPIKKRNLGGQKGHRGYGRKLPGNIDKKIHAFASLCPTCKGQLNRSKTSVLHTVEDIPALQSQQAIVTQYEIEKQWCKTCKKEVVVRPVGVIPNSRLGLNLIMQVLIWKYICRMPLNIIVALLKITYDVRVSAGALVLLLKRTSTYFGKPYQEILGSIRAAPVKHADETSWRVNGINNWCWAFLKEDAVYYTIEETRGKGTPEKIFKDVSAEDVLVRDDYAGYKNLPLRQQSCWAHLLRESHKQASEPTASQEMKLLHQKLKDIFLLLEEDVNKPFELAQRQEGYMEYLTDVDQIISESYQSTDAKRIQTRITNQRERLLTALLYEGVPLTNNLAERIIRPLVVTRKISGGSRSKEGAKAHAINMSIIQTIKMRKQRFTPILQNYILQAVSKN